MVEIINKINSKVNRLASVSNRLDGSKVALNNQFNDLPSAQSVTNQELVEPTPTKSTLGLHGFEADNGDLVDRSIKGQVIRKEDIETKAFNDIFGKLQVNTKTDGNVQTKTVDIDGTMLKTIDQRKLASSSQEVKEKFVVMMDKLRGRNNIAVQKATTDEFVNGFNQGSAKQTVQSSSGIRVFIDGLNQSINEKIGTLKNKKTEAKGKVSNRVSESSSSTPSESVSNSFAGIDLSRVA